MLKPQLSLSPSLKPCFPRTVAKIGRSHSTLGQPSSQFFSKYAVFLMSGLLQSNTVAERFRHLGRIHDRYRRIAKFQAHKRYNSFAVVAHLAIDKDIERPAHECAAIFPGCS